jgi:hypothetical protein
VDAGWWLPGESDEGDPAMLTRPITAAQPSDVIAPNAASRVPRSDGSEGLTERPAARCGCVWSCGTGAVAREALPTTAVVPRFRFHVGVSTALTDDHFFLIKNVGPRADTRVCHRANRPTVTSSLVCRKGVIP